ncbi:hypothetical protein KM043_007255 [Ampulex compressa]|nr:hypothetical protein KM043_007255 [Ampulex compressa]
MSTRSRYFSNPYRAAKAGDGKKDNWSEADIEEGQKKAKDNLREIAKRIGKEEPAERADTDGGLYVGAAGISYAYLRLSQHAFLLADEAKRYLSLAQQYLSAPMLEVEHRGDRCDAGFLLGHAGVLALIAVNANVNGDNETTVAFTRRYEKAGARCTQVDFLKCGSDEFFVGRAGFLYGALWLNRELKKTVIPIEMMHKIARTMIASGKNYARLHKSPCPLMYSYYETEYLGAAHGLCAILQVLIQVPGFLDGDADAEKAVRTSVDYLLSLQTQTGNFPCALDEVDLTGRCLRREEDELVHWCHGAPGVIYLMAAAYIRWKDERYLDSCLRAGELVWLKGLLKKGPGICHGIAGNGYVFLLLYRLTSDKLHLYRAVKFAEFMNSSQFLKEARTPDQPYSLYEGLAGTACYLADLIEPEKAAFPFQDVF